MTHYVGQNKQLSGHNSYLLGNRQQTKLTLNNNGSNDSV